MRPERICKEITEFLPNDAVVVSDTGHSGIWTGTMIESTNQGKASFAVPAPSAGPFQRPWE